MGNLEQGRQAYQALIESMRGVSTLSSCSAVLGWDKETYMPPGGEEHRAEQLSFLAGLVHERETAPEVDDWLTTCEQSDICADPIGIEAVNVRELRRSYTKRVRLSTKLVEALTRATALAHSRWVEARKQNEFSIFQRALEEIVNLTREKAEAYGYEESPYDALLDDFEPGARSSEVESVFETLRKGLVEIVQQVAASDRRPKSEILTRHFPVERQRIFSEMAAAAIGFDFHHGRLDEVVHPFCTDLGPGDVRITTRFNPHFFNEGFFGVLHEAGHALYEQGLPREHFGTPMGSAVSLAIHESQSRLWENFVGRSGPFWQHFYPKACGVFRDGLRGVSLEDFFFAINEVKASHIRVEADEVTYNLHIILRFEIERALIAGEIEVADVPELWDMKFEQMFGIKVNHDGEGCLQDTHWAIGAIGYFPTYCLGNLYAAQFFDQIRRDLPDLDTQMANGDFLPLLAWLRKNIHGEGMRWLANDLVERVTGKPLDGTYLLAHLKEKYGALYGF